MILPVANAGLLLASPHPTPACLSGLGSEVTSSRKPVGHRSGLDVPVRRASALRLRPSRPSLALSSAYFLFTLLEQGSLRRALKNEF